MDNSSLSRGRLRISLKQNLAYIKFLTRPTSPYSFKKGIPASYFEVFLAIWCRDPQGNCNKILKNDNFMLIFYLQCISQALHRIALKKLLYGKYWATDKRFYVQKRDPGVIWRRDPLLKSPQKRSNIDLAKMEHKTISMQCLALNLFI